MAQVQIRRPSQCLILTVTMEQQQAEAVQLMVAIRLQEKGQLVEAIQLAGGVQMPEAVRLAEVVQLAEVIRLAEVVQLAVAVRLAEAVERILTMMGVTSEGGPATKKCLVEMVNLGTQKVATAILHLRRQWAPRLQGLFG